MDIIWKFPKVVTHGKGHNSFQMFCKQETEHNSSRMIRNKAKQDTELQKHIYTGEWLKFFFRAHTAGKYPCVSKNTFQKI